MRLFLIVLLLFLLGCQEKPVAKPVPKPAARPAAKKVAPTFDVPALVGKNIDEVRKALGKPFDSVNGLEPTSEQLGMGFDEWDNVWYKDNHSLLVTFNPRSRKVIDFFLGTQTEAEERNPYLLLDVGGLSRTASSYTIEPVEAIAYPGIYTGITVVKR